MMQEIICLLPLLPIRIEPNHRSEMTSQLLFGERAFILSQIEEWIEIKTCFDQYIGWVELKSVEIFESPAIKNDWLVNPFPITEIIKANSDIYIPAGADIPYPDDSGCFILNNTKFQLDASKFNISNNQQTDIVKTAMKFRNAPYLWGGRSILGIDCSGFVQVLFKIAGIALPRDAKDQAETGVLINSIGDAHIGDLLFFNNDAGKIVHVGIMVEPDKIIHSSGFVRIDTIDSKGIYNRNNGVYTHTLKLIKRLNQFTFETSSIHQHH